MDLEAMEELQNILCQLSEDREPLDVAMEITFARHNVKKSRRIHYITVIEEVIELLTPKEQRNDD